MFTNLVETNPINTTAKWKYYLGTSFGYLILCILAIIYSVITFNCVIALPTNDISLVHYVDVESPSSKELSINKSNAHGCSRS